MSLIYNHLEHHCLRDVGEYPPKNQQDTSCYKLRKLWYSLILISENNPLSVEYFRSDYALRNEKRRHFNSPNYFIVHPLSKLCAVYDIYLFFLYSIAIFFKLVDFSFIRRSDLGSGKYVSFSYIMNTIDIISWSNILFLCFRGILLPKKRIVIEFRKVLLYRITSFIFWAEVISSTPKFMYCTKTHVCEKIPWVVFNILSFCKIFILCKTFALLRVNLSYFNLKVVQVIIQLLFVLAMVSHFMACMAFAVPRYRRTITGEFHPRNWFIHDSLIIEASLTQQYSLAFFKAAAQTFGISIDEFKDYATWEDSVITIVNYGIGKILHLIMWVILLQVFLAHNIQETKFEEMMTQIKQWMANKDLPSNLQKRIIDYYTYYYCKRFFNRNKIEKLLPESLESKVRVNVCKTIRESNLTLFEKLSDSEIEKIVEHVIVEVYSPKDTIIYSGSMGNSLYLIASGTVAVYSHSGKEIGHLYDGAFFGEMSLVLRHQRSTITIIALETTKIFRLQKAHFDKYIKSNKKIFETLITQAHASINATRKAEEDYCKTLFTQMYSGSTRF